MEGLKKEQRAMMITVDDRLIDGFARVWLKDWPGVLDGENGKTPVDQQSREYNIS